LKALLPGFQRTVGKNQRKQSNFSGLKSLQKMKKHCESLYFWGGWIYKGCFSGIYWEEALKFLDFLKVHLLN